MLQQLRRTFEQVVTMTIISATRACHRSQLSMDPATSLIILSAAEGVLIFILVQCLLGGAWC